MIMFCPHCGQEKSPDAAFCSNCGTRLEKQEKTQEKTKDTKTGPSTGKTNLVPILGGVGALTLIIVVLAIIFVGLDEGKDNIALPMEIGNRWEYRLIFEEEIEGWEDAGISLEVFDKETLNGEEYYLIKRDFINYPFEGMEVYSRYYRVDEENETIYTSEFLSEDHGLSREEIMFTETPLQVGEESSWKSDWKDGIVVHFEVVQFETVEVTAGTFTNCIKVRESEEADDEIIHEVYTYYAPGVGMVKEVNITDDYELVLWDYHLE